MQEIDRILEQLANGELDVDVAARQLQRLQGERGVKLEYDAPPRGTAPVAVTIGETQRSSESQPSLAPDALVKHTERLLSTWVAKALEVDAEDVSVDVKFLELGFDSGKVINLANDLGQELGQELYPTLLFEFENVAELARHLVEAYEAPVRALVAKQRPRPVALPEPVPQPVPVTDPEPSLGQRDPELAPRRLEEARREPAPSDEIAVVGYACRFPGAKDKREFWELLVQGRSGVREIPAERFDWRQHHGPEASGPRISSNQGGFLESIFEFDAPFFGISRREAELMDPQQRIFLETLWHAIEDSGHRASELARCTTGLFVGVSTFDYYGVLKDAGYGGDAHFATGVAHSVLANRASFLLDLKGPSETIDTACSSSLVALHRAATALRSGECDVAIVGGVNALLSVHLFASFSKAGMLSPEGRCRTFDAGANGYVRGEGVGVIVLKSLEQALKDGDHVRAIVRGSAVTHGGRTNSITAPSVNAEVRTMQRAHHAAGIDPATLSYVEAHGTGTQLGDPIETQALKKTLTAHAENDPIMEPYCGVGSVKSNLGHLEAAAGVAGVIKVLLALEHQVLPKTLHVERQSPLCNLDDSPLYVVESTRPWKNSPAGRQQGTPLRAGVNSFGFGGTNAHVVLERFEAAEMQTPSAKEQLFVLSAKTSEALRAQAGRLREWLENQDDAARKMGDVAYTLAMGRDAMPERLAIASSRLEQLIEQLGAASEGREVAGLWRGRAARREDQQNLIDTSDAGRAFVAALVEQRRLEKLAQLFVQGAEVDFSALYEGRRIALPGYAFAREEYRVVVDETSLPPAVSGAGRLQPALPVPTPELPPTSDVVAPGARERGVRERIRDLIATTLAITPSAVDVDAPYNEIGVDSVLAAELVSRINDSLGSELRTSDLFSYSTVRSLSAHLIEQHPELTSPIFGSAGARSASSEQSVQQSLGLEPLAVAVVGVSGMFPGANDVAELWENLKRGDCAVREVPSHRWSLDDYYDADMQVPGKTIGRWGGFLDRVAEFDPTFFGIAPKEATSMDPQQRLFLQEAYRALEDAGCSDRALSGRAVGVFVGAGAGDYRSRLLQVGIPTDAHTFMGNAGSILAARLAYALNLSGPAMTVDTACSSSLVAIHLACESLRSGDCEMAVAGGVCVLSTPEFHVFASKAGMLSPRGACHTFDQSADGMVPAEAVAALVLKPLERALADNDRIYGVIRGSAINQDGRTNGITAPSAASQAALERSVYDRFGIDPATIGYIEVHGTGTKLGDPIEVDALSQAFGEHTAGMRHCGLGSVKTNIGHALTAAGAVSVVKTLMCLQHRLLPPSLHFEKINEHIDLDRSPFYVNDELREFLPVGGAKLRRAAVSSFGFSGTNCHLVLEEAPASSATNGRGLEIVTLSAKDAQALRVYADQLAVWLGAGHPASLADVAYTLNQRRSQFSERIWFVARDLGDLRRQLAEFAREGEARSDQRGTSDEVLAEQKQLVLSELSNTWRDRSDDLTAEVLSRVGACFVAGCNLDGTPFTGRGRVVSLPGTPMRPRAFWLGSSRALSPWLSGRGSGLGPLLDRVVPAQGAARFEKHFERTDPAIADHQVCGATVVPGVAYLEMARAGCTELDTGESLRLSDVRWVSPCVVGEPGATLTLSLDRSESGTSFSIHGGETLHACGVAAPAAGVDMPSLDLHAVRARGTVTERERFYARLYEHGLEYGKHYRTVVRTYAGGDEVLAELELDSDQKLSTSRFGLHPCILDGALQAISSLVGEDAWGTETLLLPYSADEVLIQGRTTSRAFAYAKPIEIDPAHGRYRFNVALLDEKGRQLVRIGNLALMATRLGRTKGSRSEARRPVPREQPALFLEPAWQLEAPRAASAEPGRVVIVSERGNRIADALMREFSHAEVLRVFLGEFYDRTETALEIDVRRVQDFERLAPELGAADRVYVVAPDAEPGLLDVQALARSETTGVLALLRLLQAWQRAQAPRGELVLATRGVHEVLPADAGELRPGFAAMLGLAKVAAREMPGLRVGLVDLPAQDDAALSLVPRLARESGMTAPDEVAWRNGERYVRVARPAAIDSAAATSFRRGGTYVIAGGASGIGLEVAVHLARHYRANLALLGRSPECERTRAAVERVREAGGAALYLPCDICEPEQLLSSLATVRNEFGPLNGVIHSAIVLSDRSLARMTEAEFMASLASKSRGSVALAAAVARESLDFFAFFSSINSVVGNAGQANYVAGCTFKDAFARALRGRLGMATRLINWGFWGEIGIVASPEYREALAQKGLLPIANEEGLGAFEQVLASGKAQLYAAKYDARASALLGIRGAAVAAPLELRDQLEAYARQNGPDLGRLMRQLDDLDRLASHALLGVFEEMAALPQVGAFARRDELERRLGLLPKYRRLLGGLLEILASAGFVRVDEQGVHTEERVQDPEVRREVAGAFQGLERLARNNPDLAAHVRLLVQCIKAYPEVLSGKLLATDVLFPDASMSLVSDIYSGNQLSDYFNQLVAEAVASLVARASASSPVPKVLELGAGTGGTSGVVLARLASNELAHEYVYTDISAGFTNHGKRRFGAKFPSTRFRVLDVEKAPAQQGFDLASFDVVLATNVLHATRNIGRSLEHAQRLLKPGGTLLLNELTGVKHVTTMTFGLLDGWWLYEDAETRLPNAALLGRDQWTSVLRSAGYDSVGTLALNGRTGLDDPSCCQTLVVATAPLQAVAEALVERTELPMAAPRKPSPTEAPRAQVERVAIDGILDDVAQRIARVVSDGLGIDQSELDRDLPFSDFGVDSIMAVDIVERLGDALDCELRPSDLFSFSSVNALAAYVAERRGAVEPPAPEPSRNGTDLFGSIAKSDGEGEPEPRPVDASALVDDRSIAVVGLSGVFPGAANVLELWEILEAGRCKVSEVPEERWPAADFYDPSPHALGKSVSRWGGFMDGVSDFDPLFFNISPKEAELMDPQHRLFLQECYRALEDAGYTEAGLAGARCGVFAGAAPGDYALRLRAAGQAPDAHVFTGNAASILSARIAYHLNLKGPALTIDTACSSSLVAIHLACESLRSGACEVALAGGVSVMSTPQFHVLATKAGMLSPSGVCSAFDQAADGMVPGEAVGVLVLKPLARAHADGDRIYGIIRASGTNQDGKTNGITAPSAASQAALEREVYTNAGIDPHTIGYVETHGTGTKLGDPIEVDALKEAFGERRSSEPTCALASVKSNVGHTLTASGVVSVIKVLMSLRHRKLVASLNHTELNEHIQLAGSPFYVATETAPWLPVGGLDRRRAAVSSFGFSGTNCHLVIDEAPDGPSVAVAGEQIVTLSAKDAVTLRRRAQLLAQWLETRECGATLRDVAYTLAVRRTHFAHRMVVIASDCVDLAVKLREFAEGGTALDLISGSGRELPRATRGAMRSTLDSLVLELSGTDKAPREKLLALGWLYVEGHDVDFAPLYEGSEPRVASLPPYPLRKEPYFVPYVPSTRAQLTDLVGTPLEKGASEPRLRPAPPDVATAGTGSRLMVAPRWEPEPGDPPRVEPVAGTFVVLVRDEQTEALQKQLDAASQRFIVVATTPAEFAETADRYAVLSEPGDGRLLACEVLSACPDLAGIIDLTDVDVGADDLGVDYGRTAFLQELLRQQSSRPWFFLHVTSGLAATGEAPSGCNGAWFSGLLPVLDAEYRRLRARTLDVESSLPFGEVWRSVERELCLGGPASVAYRSGARLVRRWVPTPLEDVRPLELRPNAAYAVTGATGEIGSQVCQRLIARGAKKLALLGLRVPERSDWAKVRAQDPALDRKLARIEALEQRGVELWLHHGSLLDRGDLQRALNVMRRDLGELAGVVHCAGYVDYEHASFLSKPVEALSKVVDPKVGALLSLAECTASDELDFVVAFSSATSALAPLGVGVSDYAAANACVNAWVASRASARTKYRALTWTDFNDTAMGRHATRRTRDLGLFGHDTATGLDLFEISLAFDEPVLMPCVGDPALIARAHEGMRQPSAESTRVVESRPLPPAVDSVRVGDAELVAQQRLVELFSRELKIDAERLDLDTQFGDFGVDSIVVAELVHRLEPELGRPMDPAAILEHPTLRRLARFVVQAHADAVARWAGEHETVEVTVGETPSHPVPEEPVVEFAPPDVAITAPARGGRVPIAIIGIGCEFPGARSHEQFFENLVAGVSSVREVPPSRWNVERYFASEPRHGRTYSKWGGFLDEIESFDPGYFGISEDLASDIDPLERKFLMVSAQALCDAGYQRQELAGRQVGVFVGARSSNFTDKLTGLRKNTIVGIGQNFIAAHASHIFDFRGPNMVVDTACSSSLVSVHLACQSLASGESEMALAGGVDILLDERPYLLLSEAKALSPDGTCHVFDAEANGFVPGEGCGVVLLKPLDRAIADGDRIYAVIDASAVNNDGRTMGVTTPNIDAQQRCVRSALVAGDIDPRSIGYVEAHGTGTMIGDPIELKALTAVFAEATKDRQFCAIGSVKSNFGHLLSAAGIAGLIKAALSVHHKKLVPTLHCTAPNPRFHFTQSPFFVSREARDWRGYHGVWRAAVSAFGFGGTNCHVIVSSAPTSKNENDGRVARSPLPPPAFQLRRYWPEPPLVPAILEQAEPKAPGSNGHAARRPMLRIVEQLSSTN